MNDLRSSKKRIVGFKQTLKAVNNKNAKKVYLANDADENLISSMIQACSQNGIEVINIYSMRELGDACGIEVGASTVALLVD